MQVMIFLRGRSFPVLFALVLAACGGDDAQSSGAAAAGASGSGGGTNATGGGAGATNVAGSGNVAGSANVAGAGNVAGSDPGTKCDATEHTGEATYYAADGSGNCSFDKAPADPLVAAMNAIDYAGSATCGTCVAVDGPLGSITVRIVDQCPECKKGDLDMHPDAFDKIAKHADGRVTMKWRFVPCATSGPVVYHFKDGSNPWWTAVQVRGHTNAIAKVEGRGASGAWVPMPRESYNYFIASGGLGEKGPYGLRVTDVYGHVIEDTAIPTVAEGDVTGGAQLPACTP